MKALLYCTKAKPYLVQESLYDSITDNYNISSYHLYNFKNKDVIRNVALNGYIVAECEIDYITENDLVFDCGFNKESQLHINDMIEYVGDKNYYCLHLTNVKAFDEPKELARHSLDNNSEFYTKKWDKIFKTWRIGSLIKAPQNMCSVIDFEGKLYVLISIRPEWLCKILNGKKTVEVRKQILNCLKEEKIV